MTNGFPRGQCIWDFVTPRGTKRAACLSTVFSRGPFPSLARSQQHRAMHWCVLNPPPTFINSPPSAFRQVLGAPQFACFLLPPAPSHWQVGHQGGPLSGTRVCQAGIAAKLRERVFMIYANKSKEPPLCSPIDLCVPLADCLTANGSLCSQSAEISAGICEQWCRRWTLWKQ